MQKCCFVHVEPRRIPLNISILFSPTKLYSGLDHMHPIIWGIHAAFHGLALILATLIKVKKQRLYSV
jgi:hypothetical protein